MSPVVITQDASPNIQNVNFDWTAPASDNGSPVTAYKLMIMNGQTGIYSNNETLCNGTQAVSTTICTLTMTQLMNFFNYPLGSVIRAKIQAQNAEGWSELSD